MTPRELDRLLRDLLDRESLRLERLEAEREENRDREPKGKKGGR